MRTSWHQDIKRMPNQAAPDEAVGQHAVEHRLHAEIERGRTRFQRCPERPWPLRLPEQVVGHQRVQVCLIATCALRQLRPGQVLLLIAAAHASHGLHGMALSPGISSGCCWSCLQCDWAEGPQEACPGCVRASKPILIQNHCLLGHRAVVLHWMQPREWCAQPMCDFASSGRCF